MRGPIKKISFAPLGIILVGAGCFLYIYLSDEREREKPIAEEYLLGMLPLEIKTAGTVRIGGQPRDFLLGACGAALFRLSETTVNGIEESHMDYFSVARRPRNPNDSLSEYDGWSTTPLPTNWTSDGVWSGLACLPEVNSPDNSYLLDILKSGRTEGAYFTSAQRGRFTLVVIPKLRLAVLAYDWR